MMAQSFENKVCSTVKNRQPKKSRNIYKTMMKNLLDFYDLNQIRKGGLWHAMGIPIKVLLCFLLQKQNTIE